MSIRVGMVSLGCTKNQVDAERMLYSIREAGYQLVSDAALADIAVINTCGFIESAKQEAIDTILEFATLKKEGRIKKIGNRQAAGDYSGRLPGGALPRGGCRAYSGG